MRHRPRSWLGVPALRAATPPRPKAVDGPSTALFGGRWSIDHPRGPHRCPLWWSMRHRPHSLVVDATSTTFRAFGRPGLLGRSGLLGFPRYAGTGTGVASSGRIAGDCRASE